MPHPTTWWILHWFFVSILCELLQWWCTNKNIKNLNNWGPDQWRHSGKPPPTKVLSLATSITTCQGLKAAKICTTVEETQHRGSDDCCRQSTYYAQAAEPDLTPMAGTSALPTTKHATHVRRLDTIKVCIRRLNQHMQPAGRSARSKRTYFIHIILCWIHIFNIKDHHQDWSCTPHNGLYHVTQCIN